MQREANLTANTFKHCRWVADRRLRRGSILNNRKLG